MSKNCYIEAHGPLDDFPQDDARAIVRISAQGVISVHEYCTHDDASIDNVLADGEGVLLEAWPEVDDQPVSAKRIQWAQGIITFELDDKKYATPAVAAELLTRR